MFCISQTADPRYISDGANTNLNSIYLYIYIHIQLYVILLYTKLFINHDDILASLGIIFACGEEEEMLVSSNGAINLGAFLEENLIT